jgi:uncharacterized protein (DUF2236 family)
MALRSHLSPQAVLRRALVSRVQALFHDPTRKEPPVVRSGEALFKPDSVIWRVHGDVTTMMIGGVTALLLQMLHPAALAGVWEHSTFRNDMLGRLRRTARFIAVTTYAERGQADAAIERVRAVHEHVRGVLEDGTPYCASDPELLAWVHVCETIGFLDAWMRYREPLMSRADQDRYVAQAAVVALRLGAHPVPQTRAEAESLIQQFRPRLAGGERVRAVATMILDQPPKSRVAAPAQRLLMEAAVDLLPGWAKVLHDRRVEPLQIPAVRGGTWAMAQTLNWAFSGARTLQPTTSDR